MGREVTYTLWSSGFNIDGAPQCNDGFLSFSTISQYIDAPDDPLFIRSLSVVSFIPPENPNLGLFLRFILKRLPGETCSRNLLCTL